MTDTEQKVLKALKLIIPALEKYDFKWVITGGFASHVYGVNRPITDIDIDIDTSKDSPDFKNLIRDLKKYTTQPLEHFVDQNYDNYNFEITLDGIVIDICPMKEMCIYDKKTSKYTPFYQIGFPDSKVIGWKSLNLPLLSKELIIKNKEMLFWQRESDLKDIENLKKLSQRT
ncbi:MAG: hypothetical protein AAB484_01780 [Patescibacteria group bacterium]